MSEFQPSFWWRLKLEIPFELEESLIWKCEKEVIKTFAVQLSEEDKNKLIFFIWLPSYQWDYEDRKNLYESLVSLAETFKLKLPLPIWDKINDEDWSLSWKRFWQPDPVGKKLLILPAWLDLPKTFSERVVLKLDPGSAFGTGAHQTTRLCLEALENFHLNDMRVADIGCGSGILSLAAIALGAREVISVDVDPLAVRATNENALLNGFSKKTLRLHLVQFTNFAVN